MNRLEIWTVAIVLGTIVALFNLFTAWTIDGSLLAGVVVFGLIAATVVLFGAMVITGIRDRKRIVATAPDANTVLRKAAGAMRWSGIFAICFSVLLFTNCAGNVSTGQVVHVSAPLGDMSAFLSLTVWVLGPLLLALLLAPALTTAAQLLATSRPHTARRLARLATWGSALVVVVALVTVVGGFFFGVSACDFGTSAGACAAGASSLMNFLSIGSLALFLPYVGLVNWALARMAAETPPPSP